MKKSILVTLGVVIVVAVLVFVVGHKTTTKENTPTPQNANTTNTTASDAPAATSDVASTDVTIENFAFNASSVSVKVGQKVTWTNKDSSAHNVIFDDKTITSSGTLNKGDTFSATFSKAGTYTYICSFHSGMTGTVVVTE